LAPPLSGWVVQFLVGQINFISNFSQSLVRILSNSDR
jgi:hypothetical protein